MSPETRANGPSRPELVRLAVPAWLGEAVTPWRVSGATLWRSGGVRLELQSARATIPVLVELGRGPEDSGGPLALAVQDPRIPVAKARSLVSALAGALGRAPKLRTWLARQRELATWLLGDAAPPAGDAELAACIELWRAWPAREGSPAAEVEALPAVDTSALPRPLRAACIAHRIARGEILEALTDWHELPDPGPGEAPGFVEHHLDALAHALLGLREDALASLAAAESCLGQTRSDAAAALAVARAYEVLAANDRAAAAHRRVIALRGSAWDHLRLARVVEDFGPDAIPGPGPRASVEEQVSFARQVVKVFDAAGRHDETLAFVTKALAQLPDPVPADLGLRAATLHLWRTEGEDALACLARLDPDARGGPEAAMIEGAAAVLAGRGEAALACFAARPSPGPTKGATELEQLLWTAEAHLLGGDDTSALACVDAHILAENSLVAYLLKLLIYARTKPAAAIAGSIESRTFLDALVPDVLPSLCEAEELAAAHADPSRFVGLVRGILDAMGGNRGATPTWFRDGRLAPVHIRPSGRDAAVANLIRIRTEAPDEVLAGFDQVAAEYPNSPHPWTYRGELMIWLGRYEDALAAFDEADARAPTRWSWVGRAAAYDLLGMAAEADHWTAQGAVRFGELETATTHVYRGERMRKLGKWDAARRDLDIALRVKSRRVGARANLALVDRATGDGEAWDRQIARLVQDAPAQLWLAGARPGRAVDEALLEQLLTLMVGNRSSFLHTVIDGEGRFRVIPQAGVWIAHARLCITLGRRELERELVAHTSAHRHE